MGEVGGEALEIGWGAVGGDNDAADEDGGVDDRVNVYHVDVSLSDVAQELSAESVDP